MFKLDIKLKDVRKNLVKEQDDWKINLKNSQNVFEDGKLEKLLINGGNNENKKDFKFRWSSVKFCGYGFIIKDGEVKQAKYRAFIIENKPEKKYKFESKYEDNSFECKNEFYYLCDLNFISFGNVTSILPWQTYISKNNISATPQFIKDVKETLEGETRDKKVENLKTNIAEKYAKIVSEYVKAKFGACLKILNRNKANTSKITHSLLEDDLQKNVIEFLGKRVLKAKVEIINYNENKKHFEKLQNLAYIFFLCNIDVHEKQPISIINRAPKLSNQIEIESEKHNQYIVDNISHAANLNFTMKYALTTWVMDNVETIAFQEETSLTLEQRP
ncbi:hypothetical protein F8M41_009597 [Gigaspora margarita]|uniref:Uncharacterized protein n=1 Tax=Gigaspora margarita TaxID=4874 RepID=A0A8H4AUX6_GIGMA|nr:hypothetical protein F8M41_009597 [Gigaspora margarita]